MISMSFSRGKRCNVGKIGKDKREELIGNIIDYFAFNIQFCNFYQYDVHHILPILNQINFNVNS